MKTTLKTTTRLGMVLGLLSALGCGGSGEPKYVPVSGRITANGAPLAGVTVQFSPVATKANPNPGRTSAGKTDSNGKYTLTWDVSKTGAAVGEHRVIIQFSDEEVTAKIDPELGSPDGAPPPPKRKASFTIPPEYNEKTTLTFTVPPGGTDSANFDLKIVKTPPGKK